MTMKQDLANREKDIHWPQGFDPSQADLFSHNELLINASCERIWSHVIDAAKWPEWYPNSKEVKISGDTMLRDGTVFRWTTPASAGTATRPALSHPSITLGI